MKQLRISQRAGAFVALASCVALFAGGMVTAPAYAALDPEPTANDPYTVADDFVPGELKTDRPVSLTVTKFRQLAGGTKLNGSETDINSVADSSRRLGGVKFRLYEVTLNAHTDPEDDESPACQPSDLAVANTNENPDPAGTTTEPFIECGTLVDLDATDPADPQITVEGITQSAEKTTDGNGNVDWQWEKLGAVHYFVLQETDKGPNPNTDPAATTIFGLPFSTKATVVENEGEANETSTEKSGYLYNVSVFPKNLNNSPLNKDVIGDQVVKAGSKLTYVLTQQIENAGQDDEGNNLWHSGDDKLDIGDIGTGVTQPQLVVVDRVSSALTIADDYVPSVEWTCKVPDTASGVPGLTKTTDPKTVAGYQYSTSATSPNTVAGSDPVEPIFNDPADSSATYAVFEFWNNTDPTQFKSEVQDAGCTSAITITITLVATVTSAGDGTGAQPGTISNTVGASFFDGAAQSGPIYSTVNKASAGFNFAKTDSTGTEPVAGVVFRLASPADSTKYLLTSGEFADKEPTDGAGNKIATFFEATSNAAGVVSFAGLPLFKDDTTAGSTVDPNYKDGKLLETATVNTNWASTATAGTNAGKLFVVEVSAPDHYQRVDDAFQVVDFATGDSNVVGKKAKDLSARGTIQPVYTNLNFGAKKADTELTRDATDNAADASKKFYYTAITADGQTKVAVTKGLKNYRNDETVPGIGLPLTGGEGILIFLIIGAAVMGITLYVNHRRNKANVAA